MTTMNPRRGGVVLPRAIALAAAMAAPWAFAADVPEAPDAGSGPQFSWTNTIRYGAAFRVKDAQTALLANPNADDGNATSARA
nr:DUF1302 family protein [Massilia cavernae]